MKILLLGATGMLGNTLFRAFKEKQHFDTWGTLRSASGLNDFPKYMQETLIHAVDVLDNDVLVSVFERVRPDVVINCIGLIKQLVCANDPLTVLPINSLFPHRLAKLCDLSQSRLIHISTDCIFSGKKGIYLESDPSDAEDLYGKSKFIGEVSNQSHVITIRTSMIGHEMNSNYSLVNWFLLQKGTVNGYKKAIFSGLPTIEFARIIQDYIIPNPELCGLYHVAANPINKFDLLSLIAECYQKNIAILPDETTVVDRSLNATRFYNATGYVPPDWPQLIHKMYRAHPHS